MSRLSVYFLAGAAAILFAAKSNIGRADDMDPIGINIAADSGNDQDTPTATEEPEQIDTGTYATGAAGVVAINNYNNLIIDRFKTGDKGQDGVTVPSSSNPPKPQAVPNSAIPLALNDSTGAASGESVSYWIGAVSYSETETGTTAGYPETNPDAQLNNGYLADASNRPAQITISSLPNYYITNGYSVYVYFTNNGAGGAKDVVSLLNSSSATISDYYYIETEGANGSLSGTKPNQTYTYVNGSSSASTTAPASYTGSFLQSNYVDIPVAAGTSPSAVTVQFAYPSSGGSGNQGISAIELVPNAPVSVPEPASLALLLLGAVPAAWMIRRRRAA